MRIFSDWDNVFFLYSKLINKWGEKNPLPYTARSLFSVVPPPNNNNCSPFKRKTILKGYFTQKCKFDVYLLIGIQYVGDFVSSVHHKQRFLSQTVADCQSYYGSQWYSRLWERKKIHTDKTKLNPVARDDTLRSQDTKRSICSRNWTVFL